MNAQTSLNPAIVFVLAEASVAPARACSRDYGFDFDEEEIGWEMLAPPPFDLSMQPVATANPDDFELVFPCFLS